MNGPRPDAPRSASTVPPGRAPRSTALTAGVLLLAFSLPAPAGAQASQQTAGAAAGTQDERRWWNVWSTTSEENRLIWGMWTTHINREEDGWQNDKTLALIYDGFYGGTFRTTHGPRAYTLGVERTWVSRSAGPVAGMLGFRAGLVHGYDRRLGWAAEKFPILPFAQPVLYARVGPLTTDLTYTWVVISLTAALRF